MVDAFIRRDFEAAAKQAEEAWRSRPGPACAYLWVDSLHRCGQTARARQVAGALFNLLKDPWQREMLALCAGLPLEGLEPGSPLQELQIAYYSAVRQLHRYRHEQAQIVMREYLAGSPPTLTGLEARLLPIELSYLTRGHSGTELEDGLGGDARATQLFSDGHQAEGLEAALQDFAEVRKHLGRYHPFYVACLSTLGQMLTMVGRVAEGRQRLEELCHLKRCLHGSKDPQYATALVLYALSCLETTGALDDWSTVERVPALLEEALSIGENEDARDLLDQFYSRRPPGPPVPPPDSGYGLSAENPILCLDVPGELDYLRDLCCPQGHPLRGQRAGSAQAPCVHPGSHSIKRPCDEDGNCPIDIYPLTCVAGEFKCTLYFDMHHYQAANVPLTTPAGLTRRSRPADPPRPVTGGRPAFSRPAEPLFSPAPPPRPAESPVSWVEPPPPPPEPANPEESFVAPPRSPFVRPEAPPSRPIEFKELPELSSAAAPSPAPPEEEPRPDWVQPRPDYLSNNFFRLLGIASATPKAEWPEQAQAQPALSGTLGKGEEVDLAALRARLKEDPVQRCLHRLFWPLDRAAPPGRIDDYQGSHPAQILFLDRLVFTLGIPDVLNLQLNSGWHEFCNETASRIVLRLTLSEEEDCSTEQADDWVEQALHLARGVRMQAHLAMARALWQVQEVPRACEYLRQTLDMYEIQGLEVGWFAREGDRLAAGLDSGRVTDLRTLAAALQGYLRPSILASWESACQDWEKATIPLPAG